MNNGKPKFKHTCPFCKFLGNHDGEDLYYCNQNDAGELLIRRYGDLVMQYVSMTPKGTLPNTLQQARKLAIEKGYLKEDSEQKGETYQTLRHHLLNDPEYLDAWRESLVKMCVEAGANPDIAGERVEKWLDVKFRLNLPTRPKFMHNCELCTFLGHHKGVDLYYHERELEYYLVSRSNNVPTPSIPCVVGTPNYDKAKELAIAKGLIKIEIIHEL